MTAYLITTLLMPGQSTVLFQLQGDKLLYFSVELSLKCSNVQLFTADSHFLATKKFATKENDVSGDDDYASNDQYEDIKFSSQ